ncbi:MAG TPA: flagellin FliC, partial [bacterium]|nr:flagellin FliC [bacterium]
MSVVNTNISGLIGLNNLRLTNLGLQTSLERLSSGLRINHASIPLA